MPSSVSELKPVICPPFENSEARLADMARNLAEFRSGDPDAQFVGLAETSRCAEQAVRMRASVLLRTYGGDYHTDSFAVGRLAERVRDGREFIWFWGAPPEIAALREYLREPSLPVPALALGTSTVLSVADEYGDGYAESCRNGSMDVTIGGKVPYLWTTYDYATNPDSPAHRRYHTVLGTSRNRPSTTEVRGGEAIHRLSAHYLHSRFWGFVPYHVMQGGVLEQLDLVESNRDPLDVMHALRQTPPWLFHDPAEARFASALAELNFGIRPPVRMPGPTGTAERIRYRVLAPSADLASANHAVVRPDVAGAPLDQAVGEAVDSGACAVAVHVDLTQPDGPEVQEELAGRGFRLSAVVPPKRTWFERNGTRRPVHCRATGIWVRPRPDLTVVQPYYREQPPSRAAEAEVLRYLGAALAW
jgi:hypothetical protein